MGRGKAKKHISKTQFSAEQEQDEHERLHADEEEEEGGKFFACYLLTSLCPRFKGHTYIGFTVNPRRRIRQHNGEIRSGAFRTKRKRPWEMVMCIYGFPTNVAALQFEWAWQHPVESLAVRKAAATFKSLSGVGNKIKLAYTMLTLPSWQSLNLTVNFFSTKYKQHTFGCPTLPEHMRVQVCSMDELPCYSGNSWNSYENDEWNIQEECDGSIDDQQSVDDNALAPDMFPDSISSQGTNEENVCQQTNCAEERTLDQYGWLKENAVRSLRDSPVDKDNHRQSFSFGDSPVRVSSFTSSYNVLDTFEDREIFTLSDDYNPDLDHPSRKHSPPITVVAGEENHPNQTSRISSEIEVIDVFTPSPCYTKNVGSKKRRLSSIVCPEIIDLTESPIVV